jgi:glycosyltransferase involved in cell wall biosynthesis
MRIAQVAPLYESVPPQCYGGTERVVSYLTEELVRLGHEVTLFATADSVTRARLHACAPCGLRLDPSCIDPLSRHILMLEAVCKAGEAFDIIHYHVDYLHFPVSRRTAVPQVTTLHGRLDLADLAPLYREFGDMPLVSISDDQRKPLPWVRWEATVHHGVPADLYRPQEKPGDYLAFLGRISPEKRLDRAIEIARRAGMRLRVAAKVDKADHDYFRDCIQPLLGAPHVEFIGEIGEADKQAFLGNARALLFPIDWPEPFGLVMLESLACGTPIIAYRRGSVPEVLQDGVTGFLVEDVAAAAAAVHRLSAVDRRQCRQAFEARFSATRMALDYLDVYSRLARGETWPRLVV